MPHDTTDLGIGLCNPDDFVTSSNEGEEESGVDSEGPLTDVESRGDSNTESE